MWFTWSPTGFAAAAKSSINWPKHTNLQMLLNPLYSAKPGFYFWELNSNRGAHMFCSSGMQASWLIWAGAHWGHIFLQNSSHVHRVWEHTAKNSFYKGYWKTDNGWINVQNEWKARIHNCLPTDILYKNTCCLFSNLLVYSWRTEGNQTTKISIS